jgi:hypothetical protein
MKKRMHGKPPFISRGSHFQGIQQKKKAALISSVFWNLSRPNVLLKPLAGQWKVLALPQADLQTQEFYHVHNQKNGKTMATMYGQVDNTNNVS